MFLRITEIVIPQLDPSIAVYGSQQYALAAKVDREAYSKAERR